MRSLCVCETRVERLVNSPGRAPRRTALETPGVLSRVHPTTSSRSYNLLISFLSPRSMEFERHGSLEGSRELLTGRNISFFSCFHVTACTGIRTISGVIRRTRSTRSAPSARATGSFSNDNFSLGREPAASLSWLAHHVCHRVTMIRG